MEDVNANIRRKLIEQYPGAIGELALKAIALSEQHRNPAAVADRIKPLIRTLTQNADNGVENQ